MSSFHAIADTAAGPASPPPPGTSLAPERGDYGSARHPLPAPQPVQSTALDRTPREMRLTGWTPQSKRAFLEALARCGNVKSAAAFVSMSREGAYQLRRRDAAFALAWDGALVQAREVAEDELQDKALNGITEHLSYHGEVTDSRTRFDGRLLLALLGRLDKRAESPAAALGAARFDDLLDRIGADEDAADLLVPPVPGSAPGDGEGDSSGAAGLAPHDDAADRHMVWEEEGCWWTDYPPPPGDYFGVERGCYGQGDYSRELSEEEAAAIGIEEQEQIDRTRAEAQRRAAFGLDGGAEDTGDANGDAAAEKGPQDGVKRVKPDGGDAASGVGDDGAERRLDQEVGQDHE